MPLIRFCPGIFLSTLSLRRATDVIAEITDAQSISIHALLAESDYSQYRHFPQHPHFYPRSPCGERQINRNIANGERKFLSTLSLRRATHNTRFWTIRQEFLSTLSLRRATMDSSRAASCQQHFYPRSPCGERRVHYDNYNLHCVISIHALLAESDGFGYFYIIKITNFYPRSPCGERRVNKISTILITRFLSTLSLRRATHH